jgi:hypothetical protein
MFWFMAADAVGTDWILTPARRRRTLLLAGHTAKGLGGSQQRVPDDADCVCPVMAQCGNLAMSAFAPLSEA